MTKDALDLSIIGAFDSPIIDNSEVDKPFIIPEVKSIEDFNTSTTKTKPEVTETEVETEVEDTIIEEPVSTEPEESANKVAAKWFAEQGFIDFKEEEFEDSEDFLKNKYEETLSSRIKSEVDSYKDTLPEPIKELLVNYEEGVPLHEMLASEARLSEYSSIKPDDLKEDINLQKDVIKAHLLAQGYEEDEADTKITKLETALLLEDESETALRKLIKAETKYKEELIQSSKKQAIEFQKEQEKKIQQFEDSIKSIKEIFPGVTLSNEDHKRIIDLTTKIVGKDKQGRPINGLKKLEMEDPNFLAKVAYLASQKFNFTDIKKVANKEAIKKVKEVVDSTPTPTISKVDLSALRKAVNRSKKARTIF